MKRLITSILSAALLSPMWAGAQTKTTPSILGPLHYVGALNVDNQYSTTLNPVLYVYPCFTITDLRLIIQSPNNSSPIKAVSGYYTCELGHTLSTFSGTLVAVDFDNRPISIDKPQATFRYLGTFTLGLMSMSCDFSSDLKKAYCSLYVHLNGDTIDVVGRAEFSYTSAP
jgi:hypothetical protein